MTDEQKFLQYDYGETKDLLKTFLSLISATLVLSLTLSDNVVDFARASASVRYALIGSWALFIFALICAGLGVCFIAAAAGKVLYGDIPLMNFSYWKLALTSWIFVLAAGGCYVGGLAALALATGWSMGGPA